MAIGTPQISQLKFSAGPVVRNRQNVLHWRAFGIISSYSPGGVISNIGGWLPPDELAPADGLQLASNLSKTTGEIGEIC